MGEKSRICKKIASYINQRIQDRSYLEPFVGSGWVLAEIDPNRKRFASDVHHDLINMWKNLQNGWVPPDFVSESEYQELKKDLSPDRSALRAFVGFGCSFAGKWFGGYARDPKSDRNYTLNAKNSLMKRVPKVSDVSFEEVDYLRSADGKGDDLLIYCDPPYANTTGYKDTGKFDHKVFWEWCRNRTREGHTVLVSEYNAPEDFECVVEIQTRTDMNVGGKNKKEDRVERLFEVRR